MIFPSLFTSILNQTCPAMTDALFASKGTSLTYFKIKKKKHTGSHQCKAPLVNEGSDTFSFPLVFCRVNNEFTAKSGIEAARLRSFHGES